MAREKTKTDIWMPLYIGDYLAATAHLGALESGAYLHLLMHQWKNGSLPSDSEALRRIARVEKDAWSNAWALLEQFFDHATGVPVQLNLERIRAEADAKKAKSEAKAKAAAGKRWGNHAPSIPPSNASSNAQAMLETCPSSSPTHLKANTNTFAPSNELLEAAKPEVLASPASLVGMGVIPLVDRSDFVYTQADVSAWTEAYPAVDVLQQLREMREWSRANPKNRKTKSGIRRFVTQWLAKEQDRGKPAIAATRFQAGLSPPSTQPDDGTVASEYWQAVLNKRPEQFEREAPVWIKQALRKEAGRGTQDDIRSKAGMAEGANAAEEPAVQGLPACMAEAPA